MPFLSGLKADYVRMAEAAVAKLAGCLRFRRVLPGT